MASTISGMGGITALSYLSKNSNRVKDLIIDVLSNEHPLTAKKIYGAIIRKHSLSIAYQNVHKFAKELVEQGILKEIDKEYLINTEWLDQIKEFSDQIKRIYLNKPDPIKKIEIKNISSQNAYSLIEQYKRVLIKQLEAEISDKPFLNVLPLGLAEPGVRITAGKEINILGTLEQPCALLLGDSGAGKTTAFKILALQQAKQGSLIPIFFKLNNFQGENLSEIINKQLALFTSQKIGETVVNALLNDGSFMILLDGLNEVSSEIRIKNTKYDGYELVLNYFKKIVSDERFSKNKIILSCRTYNDPKERLPIPSFKLQPLTENMIELYLSQKKADSLFSQVKKHKKLLSLCQNPLMLSMLIKIFENNKLKSIKRSEIYRYFIDEFLYGWESKTIKTKKEIVVNDMVKLLSKLAYEMALIGISMDYSKAHGIMEKEAKKLGLSKIDLNELIHYILITNLLVKTGNSCEFMHQSIQEYLAALELKEKISSFSEIGLEKVILQKPWHEILIFYSALEEDATPLVGKIYRMFEQTKRHSLLFLAAKCLSERDNVDDNLFEKVLNSLLQIYQYPNEEFYLHWYKLNNLFQSWSSKRVTNKLLEFFSSCSDEISPRVVNVLHHSSSALHSQHEGIKKLREVVFKKSQNKHLLYSAIEIMALTKDTSIVPSLIQFLSDKDPILKAQSAWAIKQIGGEALDAVRKKTREPIKFLNKIQQSTCQILVGLLDKKNEDFIRGHALIELSKMDYKKAIPYILECLKDDKPIIRYHASYMIPNLDDEDASFLLNSIQKKDVVAEEYNKIVSSIGKKPMGVTQHGGRKLGI